MKEKKLQIRPYARLLTMLGDQLIKNERTALVELIKNAYDADADWVQVRFEDFNEDDMLANENSKIVVEDNGSGMTPEDIRDSWMKPAAPQKYLKKQEGKDKTPKKKRIIQGEKGIGRFAVFKLGKYVSVTTRCKGSDFESVLIHNFEKYDDDFTLQDKKKKEIYLDELTVGYSERFPIEIVKKQVPSIDKGRSEHGTLIEISGLKGKWRRSLIDAVCKDVSSLTDPVSKITGQKTNDDFEIFIVCNEKPESIEDGEADDLKGLIENNPVLKVKGEFDNEKNVFRFSENDDSIDRTEITLDDSKIKGLWVWKQRFNEKGNRDYECGGFKFNFYIFDFSRGISGKHELNQSQKNLLKQYRIYLYRDGIRVYPYGDPDDDWLNIDAFRGTGKVGDFFSNDQIVGWIDISQKNNPLLKDKTNREGLIEQGNAFGDCIGLIQTMLSYLKQYSYFHYQQGKRDRNIADIARKEVVAKHLSDLKGHLNKREDKIGVREITKIEKEYTRERKYLIRRAEMTEDLAGVGLSVEMTSHDIMLMMNRARDISKEITKLSRNSGYEEIQQQSERLMGVLSQISDGMQDVQSLFKSSKRRRKALKILEILDKIHHLYESLLEKKGIRYEKVVFHGSPLVADITDGVVMQVLINLFDNASYWLDTVDIKDKKIHIVADGARGELIFSDNGPGIDKEDEPYIFEPFYSGKGQEGRGLGLYIARQLLERYDYHISIAKEHKKILSGANFIISFIKETS